MKINNSFSWQYDEFKQVGTDYRQSKGGQVLQSCIHPNSAFDPDALKAVRSSPSHAARISNQYIDAFILPVYNTFMNTAIDTIIAEVLSLSPQARAFIAEKLIESLDSEREVILSPAWKEEVRKRCREIDEGTVELRDAEDVFARAYAALG